MLHPGDRGTMHIRRIAAHVAALSALLATLWVPPLGRPIELLAPFSLPHGPYAAGHRGIDVPTAAGDAVRAPASATVVFVGTVVDRPLLTLRIDASTLVSMEPVASTLRVGDAVHRGQVVGTVESGGHCASTCLHLGVRVDDEYMNPVRYFRARPVLLPLGRP